MNSFGYLLSIYTAFKDKDGLKPEERLNEQTEAQVYDLQSIISPLLSEVKSNTTVLNELAFETGVVPMNLVRDLQTILSYKEEGNTIATSSFSPYLEDKDDKKDALDEALYRLVAAHRVKAWCKDIADGILEYGTEPYIVPADDNEECADILNGLEELVPAQLFHELTDYLIPEDDDSEEAGKDKEYEMYLIKRMLPYYKEVK
jgi:hypothetical protein